MKTFFVTLEHTLKYEQRGAYQMQIPINNLHSNGRVHFKCHCWSVVVEERHLLLLSGTRVWRTKPISGAFTQTSDGAYCICAGLHGQVGPLLMFKHHSSHLCQDSCSIRPCQIILLIYNHIKKNPVDPRRV